MPQSMAFVLLVLALISQAIVLALALWHAFSKRAIRQLPVTWAWVLTTLGLILMLVYHGLVLSGRFAAIAPDATRDLLIDGLLTAGTSVFLAIAAIRLFQQLSSAEAISRRQREELAAVHRVILAATSTLDLDQILQQIHEQVQQLIALDAFCIALYDRTTDDLHMELVVEEGHRQPSYTIPIGDSSGPTARVIRLRQPLRIGDMSAEPEKVSTLPLPSHKFKVRSWLGSPLITQDHVVGVISVQSFRLNAFTADDERLLTTIGAQVAIAIENAELYQKMLAAEERCHALIENAKDAFFIENEADEILEVNPQACKLLGYRREELLKMKVLDLLAPEERAQFDSVVKNELTRYDRVFETVNLHRNGTRIPVEVSIAPIAGTEKGLALAIVRDISERKQAEAALRESEARFRSLFASAQRQTQELELLDRVRTALAREMDLPTVLRTVVETIVRTFGYTQVSLYLLEGDTLVLQHAVGYDHVMTHIPISQGVNGRVVRSGHPALLTDVSADADFLPSMAGIQSKVCAPLLDAGQVIGTLNLESTGDAPLSEADLRLIMALSEHIGISISRARLYQQVSRSLVHLKALGQISRDISSSLNLGQVFNSIASYAAELGGSDAAGIYEMDETNHTLHVTASYNASPGYIETINSLNIRIGQGVIGRAAATLQPAQIIDAQKDSTYEFAQLVADAGYHSILAIPILRHNKPIGGLVLWSKQRRPFEQEVIDRLAILADESVVAIENAQLYRQATRRLEEVSIIQAVALAGASGRPLGDIVAEATERLRSLWDSHHLGFLFPDEAGVLQVHPTYVGILSEIKGETRIQQGQGITGRVFKTGQPIIVPDVRQDSSYAACASGTLSEMAAPLKVGDRVIGVVNVESVHLNAFSNEDVQLLSALAGQLAIILDNAQAHRDLASHAQQLQDAYNELTDAERLKDELIQNISHELRTPMTYIRGFAELMLMEAFGPLPKDLRSPIEIVHRKTETVTHLIERIVALQTISPLQLRLEPQKLNDILHESIEHNRPQAQRANVGMDMDVPADLSLIAVDRKQLVEAFDNLLSNAVKFSPKGGQVHMRARQQGSDFVHIQVIDNGIGIPEDKLVRVFDRFYQIDGTSRRNYGGTGVGLALVRLIVEAHGGRAWAESGGPGQGSTFHVALPIASVWAN